MASVMEEALKSSEVECYFCKEKATKTWKHEMLQLFVCRPHYNELESGVREVLSTMEMAKTK